MLLLLLTPKCQVLFSSFAEDQYVAYNDQDKVRQRFQYVQSIGLMGLIEQFVHDSLQCC